MRSVWLGWGKVSGGRDRRWGWRSNGGGVDRVGPCALLWGNWLSHWMSGNHYRVVSRGITQPHFFFKRITLSAVRGTDCAGTKTEVGRLVKKQVWHSYRENGSLDQCGSGGGDEQWSDSGYRYFPFDISVGWKLGIMSGITNLESVSHYFNWGKVQCFPYQLQISNFLKWY